MMGTDAFQEVDIFGMTLPIVKHSYIIRCADEVGAIVNEAFDIATSGRPGPVLIDLPKDIVRHAKCTPARGSCLRRSRRRTRAPPTSRARRA